MAHHWRVQARRCISSTGPVSRNGQPCPCCTSDNCEMSVDYIRDRSRTDKYRRERTGGKEVDRKEGTGWQGLRIIREELSFSWTRFVLRTYNFFSPSVVVFSLTVRNSRSREIRIRRKWIDESLNEDYRSIHLNNLPQRCSPYEHAKDTDGPREWRESLNNQRTQTAESAIGVDAAVISL